MDLVLACRRRPARASGTARLRTGGAPAYVVEEAGDRSPEVKAAGESSPVLLQKSGETVGFVAGHQETFRLRPEAMDQERIDFRLEGAQGWVRGDQAPPETGGDGMFGGTGRQREFSWACAGVVRGGGIDDDDAVLGITDEDGEAGGGHEGFPLRIVEITILQATKLIGNTEITRIFFGCSEHGAGTAGAGEPLRGAVEEVGVLGGNGGAAECAMAFG